MNANRIYGFCFLTVALVITAPLAHADRKKDRMSAFTALQQVSDRFGEATVESIVELRGRHGQSQPESWELVLFDRSSPYLMSQYSVTGSKAIDNGVYNDFYPDYAPDGFIKRAKLQIDSTAVFRIVNTEASRAGVGFDSVSYHLRCREFSEEPLWRVTAKDVDGYSVGRVDVSGATGAVLRTVWYFWDERHRSAPRIVDSALIGGPRIPGQAQPPRIEIGSSEALVEPIPNPDPTTNLRPFTPTATAAVAPGPPRAEVEPVGPGDPLSPFTSELPPIPTTPTAPTVALPPPPRPDTPAIPPRPAPPAAASGLLPPEVPADLAKRGPRAQSQQPVTPANPPKPSTDGQSNRRVIDNPEGDPVVVVPLPPEE